MLDAVLEAAFVSLVIQGIKNLGLWSDAYGKVIAIVVAAFFFFANALIAAYVPADLLPIVQQAVNLVKALLSLAAVPGVFGYVKYVTTKT